MCNILTADRHDGNVAARVAFHGRHAGAAGGAPISLAF